jgi:SNF2 family DNA or RNA helicase
MVLKEYIQRGMVKSALILTPTPLVSQWQEELKTKFMLDFPSTDDPDFRKNEPAFWERPFILASINLAKSKRNFKTVIRREYDMVIVDEAHHLKNRNTLNWKLVNALKKRFLLLLTATPVENNLMELYNLITLLKPGQLKTAKAFREEFMTRGDPTSPQNRARLRELLGQVMIRNTRSLAKINIPPRFAETIRVEPSNSEKELYERISHLVDAINRTNGSRSKLLLKNLLAEAGSSPRAVELTLSRLLAKKSLLVDHEKQIQAIRNLSHSMADTRKNRFLFKLIRSLPGKKIIFVKYIGTLEYVIDFLNWEKIPHAVFYGQMTNPAKDEQIESFRESKDVLVTTEIGGEGRNLQFCHQMINYDLPWNPMKIEQRVGRIHRIGQENEVRIYNLCAAGSIEDYILEILDRKINMFEMVIGEIDMVMGRVGGEKDFSDRVYDIWVASASSEDRRKEFAKLATQLKRSKTRYQTTRTLDEKLFGENYEL